MKSAFTWLALVAFAVGTPVAAAEHATFSAKVLRGTVVKKAPVPRAATRQQPGRLTRLPSKAIPDGLIVPGRPGVVEKKTPAPVAAAPVRQGLEPYILRNDELRWQQYSYP